MIRKATKKDVTYIAEMAIMMWNSNSVEELAEEFETMLDNEKSIIYLYSCEGKVRMCKLACIIRACPQGSNTPPLWGELAKEKPGHTPLLCRRVFDCIDHMPIGFAQCGLRHDYVEGTESSPVGYLEGIFICEGYRKNGICKS